MHVLRAASLVLLALVAGCIEFERNEGTSATGPGQGGSDPTTGAAPQVSCDPLLQDCPEGETCALFDYQFACITVTLDGGAGDPCVAPGECGPGLVCVASEVVPGCEGLKCCASLCDVGEGAAAGCPAGTACVAAFTGPNVPAEYQDYGVCKQSD